MKIAYILPTLEPGGGAERVITEKANYFAEHYKYDVYIINLYQRQDSPNFYPLSEKVHQINLAIPYYSQYKYKYPKRLWIKIKINCYMRSIITQTIQTIDPEILIGVSYSQADMVSSIKCRAKKIIECHETKYIYTSNLFSSSIISKFYTNILYYHSIEKNADIVITLTSEAKQQWRKAKRVEAIPNFSSMHVEQYSNCNVKRIIAVGRLCEEKGFERLLCIWETVQARHTDWHLDIFGEGKLKDKLTSLIDTKHIKNVVLHSSTKDIGKEYANSSICAVTSHMEGFSLVILEAMKYGVPCVAFDCPYGPRNIIEDKKNGYLVENGNKDLFTEKLCNLIENGDLRKSFSASAIKRAMHFDSNIVMNKWKSLFEEITKPTSL